MHRPRPRPTGVERTFDEDEIIVSKTDLTGKITYANRTFQRVAGYREDELLLRLNAPALEGKANQAAVDFFAKALGVSRSAVTLVSGEKSRHKIFQIVGLDASVIEGKLAGLN